MTKLKYQIKPKTKNLKFYLRLTPHAYESDRPV